MTRTLFFAVLLFAAALAASPRASAISTARVADDRIVISVPVEVVGGTSTVIERWWETIDRVWNRGNDGRPFTVCGRSVLFDVRFTPSPAPSRTAHVVFVEDVAPGQRYVSSVWHVLGTLPTQSARTGYWASSLPPMTAAHEFGHLLGLLDEYTPNDVNGNGRHDPGEGSRPDEARYPDAWRSLMAYERGSILERHIVEVLRLHGLAYALDCSAAASHR